MNHYSTSAQFILLSRTKRSWHNVLYTLLSTQCSRLDSILSTKGDIDDILFLFHLLCAIFSYSFYEPKVLKSKTLSLSKMMENAPF